MAQHLEVATEATMFLTEYKQLLLNTIIRQGNPMNMKESYDQPR